MRIGILEAGHVPAELEADHGTYPAMFAAMISPDGAFEVVGYDVEAGAFPGSPEEADAWLITGSKHGVYDDLPWIEPLKAFLRDARAARRPIIGICFGHQIMAEAFGGRAEKSERGWGVGVHRYAIEQRPAWLAHEAPEFAMHAMHQDQVTAIPEDARILATNGFCPFAMLAYGDPAAPDAISIQPHPEFARPYAEALIHLRSSASVLPEDRSRQALASFGQPVATEEFGRWVRAYLDAAVSADRAA